jgi:hypothetical protein
MDPATIALIAQFALKYGPDAAMALHALFTTANPTPEMWGTLWVAMKKNYSEATGLPPIGEPVAPGS